MFEEIILNLTKRLYPTGRAFKMPVGGTTEKIHRALAKSEARAYEAATSGILDQILADNDNFTEKNAATWEKKLGINASQFTPLEDRKLAILRKYFQPYSANRAHFHPQRIQSRIQAAGFDVYVYDNPLGLTPIDINPALPRVQHGQIQHGQTGHGAITNVYKIANHIDQNRDVGFQLGDNRMGFFLGGPTLGSFADIPITRLQEFRELVMILKPLHLVGYLFANLVDEASQWILADGSWNDDGIWLDSEPWFD